MPRFIEVIEAVRKGAGFLAGNNINILIISNVVVSQYKDVLQYHLMNAGVGCSVSVADYGEIERDVAEIVKEYSHVVILWEAIAEVWGMQYKLPLMNVEERNELCKVVVDKASRVLNAISSKKVCIINKMTSKFFLCDSATERIISEFIESINAELSGMGKGNIFWVNADRIVCELSAGGSVNLREYYRSRMLHSYEYAYLFSEIAAKYISISVGLQKKLLILDCDNTLWGGLCGELEENVILDSAEAPGVIYRECQGIVKFLAISGIAVALCSKNNSEDVWKVFKGNTSMLLQESDVVAYRINWADKVENIVSIANELHLSLESIVFVDDSEHELDNVRLRLPTVEVVKVPDNIYNYPNVMRKVADKFYLEAVSSEDSARTKYYLEESRRKEGVASHASYEEYLASLEQVIKIECNSILSLQRIHQLFEKTNQFNATTRRYTREELSGFINDQKSDLYSFRMTDKYGDMGLVGAALVIKDDNGRSARLDSFIMSCRVIGKRAEYAFIRHIASRLRESGYGEMIVEYRRTKKNDIVYQMYKSLAESDCVIEKDVALWALNLNNPSTIQKEDYVQIIFD